MTHTPAPVHSSLPQRAPWRASLPRSLQASLQTLWLDLVALALPADCVGCGRSDRVCCQACQRALLRDARLGGDRFVSRRDVPLSLAGGEAALPVFSAADYHGRAGRLTLALKHEARLGLARFLGPLLADSLQAAASLHSRACDLGQANQTAGASQTACAGETGSVRGVSALSARGAGGAVQPPEQAPRGARELVVVPVPSRPQHVRRRGYRQVEVLLRAAGVPRYAIVRALHTAPGRTAQMGSDSAQRAANARRLRVQPRLAARLRERGTAVLLVDDICTSGASLAAAAEALIAQGITVHAAATVCRVRRFNDQAAPHPKRNTMNSPRAEP